MLNRFKKGNLNEIRFGGLALKSTIVGDNVSGDTQTVGTSDETLPKGDIGTIGYLYVKNLDETNYVTIGADATNQPIKVTPKQQIFTGFNGAAVHAKANTGACKIQFLMIEA